MAHADFVHLRVHTAYSLSEGAIKIEELVKLCRRERMPAVAITDSGNLFGALEFALAAAAAGVQPIIGCQLAIRRDVDGGGPAARTSRDHLVVLVQDEVGYRNLLSLVSRAYLEGGADEAPLLPLDDLQGHSDGLIALTGGPGGGVDRRLAEGQRPAAEAILTRLEALFPGRLYVELQRHGTEARVEPELLDLAYARELPLVATNEPFFAGAEMWEAHDVLLCISEGAILTQAERRRVTAEHRFKSAEEMRALFADLPEAVDNTLVVARRCAFVPETRAPILPPFEAQGGRSEAEELRTQATAGIETRLESQIYGVDTDAGARDEAARPYRERLAYELEIIETMGFAGYFLIVADFIQWARSRGIPVGPGRGSGAGSVVSWALTITDLDPLRWGLLFERFLNPKRVTMPDFDIDFCQDRRDEVIRYVQDTYGRDRVAQIITFGKLQARAVLRDVGRVLAMPYGQVDRICKLVPNNPANPVSLAQAIEAEPQLRQMREAEEQVARLLDIGQRLEGLYRHASTHAAGVVIADRPLQELVPLYRDPRSDMPVTQFNMKYVELAGLVKFDFLGLKTLTVLAQAVDMLARRGTELDLARIPLEDERTLAQMSRGETVGVFQFESPGMRNLLQEAKVHNFEDIIALVALYRPGPMENIPKYVACKHRREEPERLHESIEPVVKDTYGVIIYQEQVMQIAQVFAGFDLGQADLLRRAMGKKIKSEMEAQRETFVQGAIARGVDRARASYVFDLVDKFAGYGFPLAHAAGYALIAYQTAYLKANHPVEFLAASMNLELGNTEKLGVFRQELVRLGIPLMPPDVDRSEAVFTVEALPAEEGTAPAYGIRYALAAIKGVGRAAMASLAAERATHGPFGDLLNLAGRLDRKAMNKRQLEQLACAGALDGLNANRGQSFAAAEALLRHAHTAQDERESGQTSLFGDTADTAGPSRWRPPAVPDWESAERLNRELAAIGFYFSAHPLDGFAKGLARLGVVDCADLPATLRANSGTAPVKVAGALLSKSERTARSGGKMAFVQLTDNSGAFEVLMFSEALAQARGLMDGGRPLLIHANARLEEDQVKLQALKVEDLEEAVAEAAVGLRIWVGEAASVGSLAELIRRQSRNGRGNVSLVVSTPEEEIELALPGHYPCTPQVRAAIKAIPGVIEVQEL